MNFIKKIFDKRIDESVHMQFQKFSRGEFKDRAIVKVKKTGNKFTISTTAEFGNEFVRILAQKLGKNKTNVTGSIIGTNNLKGELEFKKISQFQGVKNYSIEQEMSGEEILKLLEKFPKNFFALSFSANEDSLKIKPKAPKSTKPKNKEETPKPDFCKMVTTDANMGKGFVWEKPDFKEAIIAHDFMIESIVIPNELKNEKDFAIIREKSQRKGKIIRRAVIDENEMKSEVEFEA
ncbi:hypothetical protein A3K82_03515 [Candidatus Pacearchaeota archaeon RBG_19FT_COMBO_34_9]|nr:MAG: hypothetical protein A3K82_03515 [Candidatus Pacearchaeota archaeon RBG_19FT_COMBO_34_9]OGJ16169.1 MAG: hypothetical protein A3K74_03000 [Candidatus Pacearchaeota archaeon RBG_13_33_26]